MSNLISAIPEQISALDRGLAYGDGLFETLAVRDNAPCFWDAHMRRLSEGCARLGIPVPDLNQLHAQAKSLCLESQGAPAVLKVMLTRGQGGRGYRAPEAVNAWHGLALYHAPEYPEGYISKGVKLCVCKTRLGMNPVLAGIKHLNRLEQVLARNEFTDEFQEGIMLDTGGHVVEGTMSNLFAIADGKLLTPDVSQSGIRGITRDRLIEWAHAEGVSCDATSALRLEQVFSADALLVTNSVIGVWPVRKLEDVEYAVDNELLQRIIKEFPALCA